MRLPLISRLLRSDLPVASDSTGGFLPWLIAMMVFLAALAVAGALGMNTMVDRWSTDMAGTLTVQVPTAGSDDKGEAKTVTRVERAIRLLRSTPGIDKADEVPVEKLADLLEPWLGSRDLIRELPTPRLIDVHLDPHNRPSLADLDRRLKDAVPGASLDDHQVWMSKLVNLAEGLRTLAWAVILLVSFTTASTVIYATRTALEVHRPHIEVLHFVGATDSYIAGQFAYRGLWLGLLGGIIGLLMAVPTLWIIGRLALDLQGGLIPDLSLRPITWGILAILPFLAGGIAMLTARYTVRRQLARML